MKLVEICGRLYNIDTIYKIKIKNDDFAEITFINGDEIMGGIKNTQLGRLIKNSHYIAIEMKWED